MKNRISLALMLVSLSVTHAHSQFNTDRTYPVNINTSNRNIACTLHVCDEKETEEFFFVKDVVNFYNMQEGKSNPILGLIDRFFEGLEAFFDKHTNEALPDDPNYRLSDEQRLKLEDLKRNYLPITVNIVNNGDNPAYLSKDAYLPELKEFLVDDADILAAYPHVQPLGFKPTAKTLIYFGAGVGLATLGAGFFGGVSFLTRVKHLSLITGIPASVLILNAVYRYGALHRPVGNINKKREALKKKADVPSILNMSTNMSTMDTNENYEIPGHSIFTVLYIGRNTYHRSLS